MSKIITLLSLHEENILKTAQQQIVEARDNAKAEYARLKDDKAVAKAREAAKVEYQRLGKDLKMVEAALERQNPNNSPEGNAKPATAPKAKSVKGRSQTKKPQASRTKAAKASAPAPAEQQEQEPDNRPQEEDDASRQAVADASR